MRPLVEKFGMACALNSLAIRPGRFGLLGFPWG